MAAGPKGPALSQYEKHTGKGSQQETLANRFQRSTVAGPMTVERMMNNYGKKSQTAIPSETPFGLMGPFRGL
jgi:hypothetical protein